jgi:hypothetical protein
LLFYMTYAGFDAKLHHVSMAPRAATGHGADNAEPLAIDASTGKARPDWGGDRESFGIQPFKD